MAYVQVPKDLTKVKTKVLFNLTKRQLYCFIPAAILAIPFYLLTRGWIGNTFAACIMIVIAIPFLLFAIYEKDGRPLEVILRNIYRQKYGRPGIRLYRTVNLYAIMQEEIKEKEETTVAKRTQNYKRAARKKRKTKKTVKRCPRKKKKTI